MNTKINLYKEIKNSQPFSHLLQDPYFIDFEYFLKSLQEVELEKDIEVVEYTKKLYVNKLTYQVTLLEECVQQELKQFQSEQQSQPVSARKSKGNKLFKSLQIDFSINKHNKENQKQNQINDVQNQKIEIENESKEEKQQIICQKSQKKKEEDEEEEQIDHNANHFKFIMKYRSLKEYCKISREVILELGKLYDNLLQALDQQSEEQSELQENLDKQQLTSSMIQKVSNQKREKSELLEFSLEKMMGELEIGHNQKINDLIYEARAQQIELNDDKKALVKLMQNINKFYGRDDIQIDLDFDRLSDASVRKVSRLSTIMTEGSCSEFLYFCKKYQNALELSCALLLILILPIYILPFIAANYSQITSILSITIPLAFFLGAAIGGNDICNAMGTPYGSKTLNMAQVIILGIIFESLGAMTMGTNVAKTISTKVIDINQFQDQPNLFSLTMAAVLGAAAFSSITVTIYGLPVSITQGVIFGMAAVGICSVGWDGVDWGGIGQITLTMVTSPLVGVIFALLMYMLIIKGIYKGRDPYSSAIKWLPFLGFFNVFIVVFMVMYKGIKIKPLWVGAIISVGIALLVAIALYFYGAKMNQKLYDDYFKLTNTIDKQDMAASVFKPLLVISACCVSFTHGSNDVGNCVGPLASVLSVYKNHKLEQDIEIPFWTLAMGAGAFSCGILLMGKRTIKTMGEGVTNLNPMKAFTVQMGTATAILVASVVGMPVSTSHCTVGSVLGSTLAEKIMGEQFQFKKESLKKILASWVYTIPFVFFIAIYFYYSLKGVVY